MLFRLEGRYYIDEGLIITYFKKYFGDRLLYIIVYGSRGYGIPKENTDYDLIVVLENLDRNEYHYLNKMREVLEGEKGMKVDTYFVSKKVWDIEWYNPLYLVGQAVVSGRLIYTKYKK